MSTKQIIMSLSTLVFVAAVVVSGTGAFFSDTETSTGNVFTAGAIDLKIDSEQHYNGMICTQGTGQEGSTWQPENDYTPVAGQYPVAGSACDGTWGQDEGLNIIDQNFFNFSDIKPGDEGENTISLHVDNNPAWACANIEITSDEDVTCTEPEIGAEGSSVCTPNTTSAFNGEIGKNLSLAWWQDDGDNILESGEEDTLFFLSGAKLNDLLEDGGAGNKVLKLTLADSLQNFFTDTHTDGQPLNGSQPYFFGLQWCFGDMSIDGTDISCNGATVNNESQTDSLTANMTFTVEQARNNETFRCEDTYKPQQEIVHVTSNPLNFGPTGWAGWSCPADTTVVDDSLVVSGGDLAATYAWQSGATTTAFTYPQTGTSYVYGTNETGFIGQNDNDSGESIVLDFNCLSN